MTLNTVKIFLTILLVSLPGLSNAENNSQDQTKKTRISSDGIYTVTIESYLKPLMLGRMHAWTANIRIADGEPVTNASIQITGGMPIHNHGFPTKPEMTKQIEPGLYLMEGFKFSMQGPWIIILDITVENKTDTVAFNINM